MNKTLRNIKGGFTLIELLVVIAIIAILASLAVPAVMKAKVKANVTKSASNMKQVVLACKLYAADNNESYPSASVTTAREFFQLLLPNYAGSEQIFVIPGYTLETPSATSSTNLSITNGYTYVASLADTSDANNIVVTEPTQMTYGAGTYTVPNLTAQTPTNGVFQGTGINVAKVDGSVSFAARKASGSISNLTSTNGITVGGGWFK